MDAEHSPHYPAPLGEFSFVLCKHRAFTPGILNFICFSALLPQSPEMGCSPPLPTPPPVLLLVMVNLDPQKPCISINDFLNIR